MAADKRPSFLIISTSGSKYGLVDTDYLKELNAAGFEVDYTDGHTDFTWQRIRQYNVIVIYNGPEKAGRETQMPSGESARVAPLQAEFRKLVNKYLAAGGSVFMMLRSENAGVHLTDLLQDWDAKMPLERIVEDDGRKIFPMVRMRGEPIVFTDQVFDSPVSDGVKQIWYPYNAHYNSQNTAPIWVSKKWTVVVRASKTSRTSTVDLTKTSYLRPQNPFIRKPIKQPVLFAIRKYKMGRIAFCSQWPMFSFGQGTKWMYERRVLSKGAMGKPSHFGQLIENTLHWLAEPSLKSGKIGGYVTDSQRLLPRNLRPEIIAKFKDRVWKKDEHDSPWFDSYKMYRGLIGVQTNLTSGKDSVAKYAKAARAAKLDYIVFIEEFSKLNKSKLEKLHKACRKHSGDDLQLFAGYTIDTNTGNHLFAFGPGVVIPPDDCLYKGKLNIQYQDPKTGEYQHRNIVNAWILQYKIGHKHNVGYYHFSDDPRAMKIKDLKNYSMAALRYYKKGKLIEDMTDAYLLGVEGGVPPTPISFNLVRSAAELKKAVAAKQGLTYAKAPSLKDIYLEALDWSSQISCPNVFPSDGPMIQSWPYFSTARTYSEANFVTGDSQMPSLLHVKSEIGLKDISIYNGRRLFRRFLPNGAREFKEILQLNNVLEKHLAVVVEDVKGNKAVSYARNCWKGDWGGGYCTDHVNQGDGFLAKGQTSFLMGREPEVFGGFTWDGGAKGVRIMPFLCDGWSPAPRLISDKGREGDFPQMGPDDRMFNNTPLVHMGDESVMNVTAELDQVFDGEIAQGYRVGSPWHSYGPVDPSRLMKSIMRYAEFAQLSVGPSKAGWAWQGDRRGARISVFSNTITFKKNQKIEKLILKWSYFYNEPTPVFVLHGDNHDNFKGYDISPKRLTEFTLKIKKGHWFGFYSPQPSNGCLVINRGETFNLNIKKLKSSLTMYVLADLAGKKVKKGESHHYEFISVTDRIDTKPQGPSRFLQILRYLKNPDGFELMHGKRNQSIGLFELQAQQHKVEFALTKPQINFDTSLPVRISGLNRRWSAGYFQKQGYAQEHYGSGENRYRAAGIDDQGRVYATIFPDYAARTHVVIGHPIISDKNGRDLFIQVMHQNLRTGKHWHVSVNNPTDRAITTKFYKNMDLPGFEFRDRREKIPAGGYVILN